MAYDPTRAEIRFGYGLSPDVPAPVSSQEMLSGLTGPDDMDARYPIDSFDYFRSKLEQQAALVRQRRQADTPAKKAGVKQQLNELRKQAARDVQGSLSQSLRRCIATRTAFRERLVWFWADHFTARGKAGVLRHAAASYVEHAIRPNLAGKFEDLVIAASSHPLMLHYLDQNISAGPNSAAARRRQGRGLNENLARELLELHTMGVGGGYSQRDIEELAKLLTGFSYDAAGRFRYRSEYAEPGPETVLGQSYGGTKASPAPVLDFLRDVAMRPETAGHVARKLAVHFVSEDPQPELIDHITSRYLETGGDLLSVYAALLEHPAAWSPALNNVKPPFDFMVSACRALGADLARLDSGPPRQMRRRLRQPLARMGQPWLAPSGPDGWPEEDAAWITPQALAARLNWAMSTPVHLVDTLPDPRAFVRNALGDQADQRTLFAANAAETQAEGIGLILMSPAFQRR